MTSKHRWRIAGLIYFAILFYLIPAQALAYIDPSVTSYAVQALAGIVVAAGAFFAAYGRKARKRILKSLGIDDVSGKPQEPKAEIYLEDLREENERRKADYEDLSRSAPTEKKADRIRYAILSVICGLAVAMTLILRPCISFYLDNEGEFWFSLGSVIGKILLVFGGAAMITALIHALLPDKRIQSPRLLFAALAAAIALCAFFQNHAMSSYLPVLTGDPIDWSKYSVWGIASAALWGGVIILSIAGFIWRPRALKMAAYGVLVLLLCTESISGAYALATAKHENQKTGAYFTAEGLYDTSEAGNIVILVSDTFEGTYMNEILEQYPEYREMLNDITYYDNVTGVSIFTYFSYGQFLTGIDYPLGMASEEGVQYCFEHETTIDTVRNNGWDVGYYTTFSPTKNLKGKVINYCEDELTPDSGTAWKLTGNIIRSTLFQSMPQVIKPFFLVYTSDYEGLKAEFYNKPKNVQPYVEDDMLFYQHIIKEGLEAKAGKPKYSVIQFWGIHEPSTLNAEYERVEFDESVPVEERKIEGGRAQLKLLREYLDCLKAAGTYDNTTVIMMADHGFGLRYYPVFLVKEAHRKTEGFRTDHTPLSIREDLETLLAGMTAGERFSETAAKMKIPDNRIRYALSYRGQEYDNKIDVRSLVEINGEAKDPASYRVVKDEFAINDQLDKRYQAGTPFVSGRVISDNVDSYGMVGEYTIGHTALFDLQMNEAAKEDLTLKMRVYNMVYTDQRVIICLDGKELAEVNLPWDVQEIKEITVPLPVQGKDRIQIEIRMPDAELRTMQDEVLGWMDYNSIMISDAIIE